MGDQLFKIREIVELKKGDIILHPIFRSDGLLFLKKYKKLSDSLISRLLKLFPKNFPVIVATSEENFEMFNQNEIKYTTEFESAIEEIISTYQKYIDIPFSIEHFIGVKQQSNSLNFLEAINEDDYFFMWDKIKQIFDSSSLLSRSNKLISELNQLISNDESLIILYQRVKKYHDVLYIHSLNTTFLSFIIGITLELSDEEMIDLTIASLFSNIGFTKIPEKQFNAYLDKKLFKF